MEYAHMKLTRCATKLFETLLFMKLFSFHIQFETATCYLSASLFNYTLYSSHFTTIFIAFRYVSTINTPIFPLLSEINSFSK